ncbi:MAG TPA: 6-phosphogluconolactonase [Acidimicrobiales bacterium]|nr:6-phosphogluconolactonase [Acidimicrobiales bacterium]
MHGELEVVEDVAAAFVTHFRAAHASRPGPFFSVALSGGETARRCYERLAEEARDLDWMTVDLYWGDERCVPPTDPASNQRLAREALMERTGGFHAWYPMSCDEGPDAYQLRLSSIEALDLVHLGLGADAHTASLFPDSRALTADPGRWVALNDDPSGRNDFKRMTLTPHGIARARHVVVTVSGEQKKDALDRVRRGDPTAPGTLVRGDDVTWLADRAAAGG